MKQRCRHSVHCKNSPPEISQEFLKFQKCSLYMAKRKSSTGSRKTVLPRVSILRRIFLSLRHVFSNCDYFVLDKIIFPVRQKIRQFFFLK